MEKMIKVPEGMLKAALDIRNLEGLHHRTFEAILEEALRWLSENPIVPTDEQAQVMLEKVFNDPPFIYGSPNDEMPGQNILINREQLTCPHLSREQEVFAEWQRRMFLAPPAHPTVTRVKEVLMGCTLTSGDAVELMDAVRMCTRPEPEVPEEIKDLLWNEQLYRGDEKFFEAIPKINQEVIEAYRRGQRSKE